jgi:exopolyphosphatase/guanosine-5'-triphosphate,3'-diphosphate pyrophosphatase
LIISGAIVADRIVKKSGAENVIACSWALREGVLLDFIARHRRGIEESSSYENPRVRSVMRLARHLGEAPNHGTQVARLALRLFDQLEDDLNLDEPAREWLEYAALLHDIGHHISHRNHHKHSYYLIQNGELLGFSAEEIEAIALIARYHRKATPKDGEPELANLSEQLRDTVCSLSAILRVADSLDRSHFGLIRDIEVKRKGDRLILYLKTAGSDVALEIWEAEQRAKPLAHLLSANVEFRVTR